MPTASPTENKEEQGQALFEDIVVSSEAVTVQASQCCEQLSCAPLYRREPLFGSYRNMWLSKGQENKHKLVMSRALGRGPTAEALELTSHWVDLRNQIFYR